ncbi:MAG: fhuA [Bacteroidetes bacterium]|nr:fhuA [Bacteroidota bacterium]
MKHLFPGLKLPAFILFVLVQAIAIGQNGSIKGKISTSEGKAAEYVNVGLVGTKKWAATDQGGQYTITDVPAGKYTLKVSTVGLQGQAKDIEVIAGESLTVDFLLPENTQQLQEIVIEAAKSNNERPVAIGKIAIRSLDLPQSIAVIDKATLEQQQSTGLTDVLKNVNGVYLMGNTGGTQEEIAGRGFAFTSSNTFKNGVRYNNTTMPEITALESVEIMKGSSAILFGNVAAGGIINLVTKKPLFKNGGEVSMRTGSFDFYKPSIDVYGVLNPAKTAAYRVNTVYERSHSFRDVVNAERFYINPSVALKLTPKLDVLVEGDYLRDNRTNDYGVGAIDYQLIDVPRSTFLGAKWSYNKTEQKSISSAITYHFSDRWEIRNVTAFQDYDNDLFGTTRPNASSQFIRSNGNWKRGVQRTAISEEYLISQLDLTGRFSTGFLKHNLLVGVDADKYYTKTIAYKGIATYDSINVFDLEKYRQRNDIPDLTINTTTVSPVKRAGAYIQDLVSITKKIKLLAGVRITYIESFSDVNTYATNTTTKSRLFDHAITPRFGIVYQPLSTTSIFASYSNSFALNTGVDINGDALAPSYINQYEAGIKNDLFKGFISTNLTVYQIVNSGLAQMSLENGNTNANVKELAGEVTSQGLELDLSSRPIKGISFIAGYSYNDTRYTKSNTFIVGSKLRYNPSHTANASIYYAVNERSALRGLNFGFGAFYVGDRVAGRSTRVTVLNDSYKLMTLPDYCLLDASIGYSRNRFSLRVKVSNLLDVLSYNVHDDNSVNPIAPRSVMSTISYKF